MEETVPILHRRQGRCNTYRSKNPYGGGVSHLCVICPRVQTPVMQGRNDRARSGEYL
jgi:hypothetical protein